jgi:hypothetical protein
MMLLPEWTEQTAKRGIDPLGLQNSGVQPYRSLVAGVSSATQRIGLAAAEVDGPVVAEVSLSLDQEPGVLVGGVA